MLVFSISLRQIHSVLPAEPRSRPVDCLRQDQLGTAFPLGLADAGHGGALREVGSGGEERLGTTLALLRSG